MTIKMAAAPMVLHNDQREIRFPTPFLNSLKATVVQKRSKTRCSIPAGDLNFCTLELGPTVAGLPEPFFFSN